MADKSRKGFQLFLDSVASVFNFFFFLGKKARKTKVFFLISSLPVLIALIFKVNQLFSSGSRIEGLPVFSNLILVFYLQFLIIILALFYGTSICSEEIEGRTLTYLTTRPVSKPGIVVGKYAAYTFLAVIMMVFGVVLSFLILNVEKLLDFSLYVVLLKDLGVLALGLACYTAFFTLIGTLLKKSVLFGLFFGFGWENVIQYFPGSTQRFAIVHYLKSLLPPPAGKGFSFLIFRLEPSSPGAAVFMLFLLTAVFLGLACWVFSGKDYILED